MLSGSSSADDDDSAMELSEHEVFLHRLAENLSKVDFVAVIENILDFKINKTIYFDLEKEEEALAENKRQVYQLVELILHNPRKCPNPDARLSRQQQENVTRVYSERHRDVVIALVLNPDIHQHLSAEQFRALVHDFDHVPEYKQAIIESYFPEMTALLKAAHNAAPSTAALPLNGPIPRLKLLIEDWKNSAFTEFLLLGLDYYPLDELYPCLIANKTISNGVTSTQLWHLYNRFPLQLFPCFLADLSLCQKIGYNKLLKTSRSLAEGNYSKREIAEYATTVANNPAFLSHLDYDSIRRFVLDYHHFLAKLPLPEAKANTAPSIGFLENVVATLKLVQPPSDHWFNFVLAKVLANRRLGWDDAALHVSLGDAILASGFLVDTIHQLAATLARSIDCQQYFGPQLIDEFIQYYATFCDSLNKHQKEVPYPFSEFIAQMSESLARACRGNQGAPAKVSTSKDEPLATMEEAKGSKAASSKILKPNTSQKQRLFAYNLVCQLCMSSHEHRAGSQAFRDAIISDSRFFPFPEDFVPSAQFVRYSLTNRALQARIYPQNLQRFAFHHPGLFMADEDSYLHCLIIREGEDNDELETVCQPLLNATKDLFADQDRFSRLAPQKVANLFSWYQYLFDTLADDQRHHFDSPEVVLNILLENTKAIYQRQAIWHEPTQHQHKFKTMLIGYLLIYHPEHKHNIFKTFPLNDLILGHRYVADNLSGQKSTEPEEPFREQFIATLCKEPSWLSQLSPATIHAIMQQNRVKLGEEFLYALEEASLAKKDDTAWLKSTFESLLALPFNPYMEDMRSLLCCSEHWLGVCANIGVGRFCDPDAADFIYHQDENAAMILLQTPTLMNALGLNPEQMHFFQCLDPNHYLNIAQFHSSKLSFKPDDEIAYDLAIEYAYMIFSKEQLSRAMRCCAARIHARAHCFASQYKQALASFIAACNLSTPLEMNTSYYHLNAVLCASREDAVLDELNAFWLQYESTDDATHQRQAAQIEELAGELSDLDLAERATKCLQDDYQGDHKPSLPLDENDDKPPPALLLLLQATKDGESKPVAFGSDEQEHAGVSASGEPRPKAKGIS